MKVFDSDVAYGRGAIALACEIETADQLAAELERLGIGKALTWHRDAYERDFERGNHRLTELAAFPALHPVYTWAPACCEDMPAAETFITRLRGDGVRAVRAFPARQRFVLDAVACGGLLDAFQAHRVPLLIPLGEFPGRWQGVYAVMKEFPQLTLIVTQSGCWGEDRYFRPLMKRYDRFFMTTNRLETAGQLKAIVDAVGPGHVVFGSGLPFNNPGGYLLMLARADIPEPARQAIAHGNLERLMEDVAW